jgi:DNA-directed RNA polymerase specialized sigma24 family protein
MPFELPAAAIGTEPTVEEFGAWVQPHLVAMANLAARMVGPADRDDVVQESLARAWRRWGTYRTDRGTPQVWLLAIVADRARRHSRSRGRRPVAPWPVTELADGVVHQIHVTPAQFHAGQVPLLGTTVEDVILVYRNAAGAAVDAAGSQFG